MKNIKLKTVNLKAHHDYNERWLQKEIADGPSILGLGDVVIREQERIQPGAGRLDLLLQDADGHGRYEVEIQLGATDASHIIRTIEYWDIERKKYPQYDHTAVLVAEDVTSRFLNVIGLFNGVIPIMAIQLTAIETSDGVGLLFTKILDTVELGYIGEDEEISAPTDREYWENKASKGTTNLADKILEIIKLFILPVELSYNKFYIGIHVDGRACNFAKFRPRKTVLNLEIRLPQTEQTDKKIMDAELNVLDYDKRWSRYRIKLTEKDIDKNSEMLKALLQQAYSQRQS